MNKVNLSYYPIAILLNICCSINPAISQIPFDTSYREEAIRHQEFITLFTDRNMYAINERIFFSAYYRQSGETGKEAWSRVLYVELVTPSGSSVSNGKFHLDNQWSSGSLLIPADILTGNYYLRSYTRWMQNFGPGSYCYTPLKIINPYIREVLKENNESSLPDNALIRMDHPGINCRTNKRCYAPGEEVRLELSQLASGDIFSGQYCLTVVNAGLSDTLNAMVNTGKNREDKDFSFNYLPDIRGVSISGSVVNSEDQSPAPGARLHFSILGKQAEYFGTLTDEMGRFILTLPGRTGRQEIFVACEPSGDTRREVRIDQDFSSDPIPFRTGPFSLSPFEKDAAARMVRNMQFSNIYGVSRTILSPGPGIDSIVPFYGKPTTTILLDEFVKLPTMNEVFVNLVPNVFVFYNKGEPYLNIHSSFHNISIFPPLILIDKIPVFDHRSVFLIAPEKLERIEVINDVYVRGGMMYGGMILLTSREGDMAAVDLPEGSYFFDYQAFHQGNSRFQYTHSERIPDTRNTLLWIDKFPLDRDEIKSVQFPASSHPGEYIILVRGATPDGEIVYGKSSIIVE